MENGTFGSSVRKLWRRTPRKEKPGALAGANRATLDPSEGLEGMSNLAASPAKSNVIVMPVDASAVAAARLAKRFRLSAPHALVVADLAGLGAPLHGGR